MIGPLIADFDVRLTVDVTLLRTFLSVSSLGSFTEAARHMNASQSTISGHVAKLEEQLQTQLFIRTTRRCTITAAGRDLIRHATEIVEAVDRLENTFHPGKMAATIRLGVPDDYHLFATVAEVVKSFVRQRPKVALKIESGLSANHRQLLKDGHLDLALLRTRQDPDRPDALRPVPLVWVASPSFNIADFDVLPLAHVSGPCLYFAAAREALDKAGLPWRDVFSCSTLEGVRSAVAAGMAIAAIPSPDLTTDGLRVVEGPLPVLPSFGLVTEFSHNDPMVLVRILAKTLQTALQVD